MAARVKKDESPRTPLTPERVVSAAIELADEKGVAKLTMRGLAASLGVEAMSLYYHFANKGKILDAMVDAVFAEVELPAKDDEWKPAMRARAGSLRSVLLDHTWAIALMDSRPDPGLGTITHHDAIIGCLRSAGFSMSLTAHAFSVIDSYVYGFVSQESGLPFQSSEELADVAGGIIESLPVEQFPHFSEMVAAYYLHPEYSFAEEFLVGLDLILDGLERLRAAEVSDGES